MASVLFYVMACLAVLCAAGVVVLRTAIASVIALLGCFFCLATIYLLAGFPFVAAVQILVYSGAVLVLFLFVIMLLNLADATGLQRIDRSLLGSRRLGPTVGVALALLGAGLIAVHRTGVVDAASAPFTGPIDSPGGLAGAMFSRYLLPFEATSLLLLATAVAVLVLAKRERGRSRPLEAAAAAGAEPPAIPPAAVEPAAPAPAKPKAELVETGGAR